MGGSSTSPLSIGSFLNGIGTNFASGGNPITGALMNASILAGSGGRASSLNPTSGGGFNPTSGGGYGSIGVPSSGYGSGGESLFGFDPTFNSVGSDILGSIGQNATQAFKAPLFGQGGTISNVGQAAGAYNQVNQLLGGQQQPMQMPGAMQIQRGQIAPIDYMSLLNPQNQSVIRPPQISLLG